MNKLAEAIVRAYAVKVAKELDTKARKHIATKNFAISEKARSAKTKAESGNYPIHDRRHAANALSRVKQHGSPEEIRRVVRKVCAKYPTLPTCQKLRKRKGQKKSSQQVLDSLLARLVEKLGEDK